MKLAQISDSHIGITTEGQLRAMLKKLQKEEFDVLIHCGDYGGTYRGDRCVKRTVKMMRHYFPNTPIVSVIGNHDYWCRMSGGTNPRKPSLDDFNKNLTSIRETFKEHRIHFLDDDGIYIHPSFPEIVLLGSSGWYANPTPNTNDFNFLPIGIDGDTDRYLLKTAEANLFKSVDQLDVLQALSSTKNTVVFVSHFPVIDTGDDYKGAFEAFSWRASLGEFFVTNYNCKHFLCGHAHQLHKGPLRYECGPDYYKPSYQLIDI